MLISLVIPVFNECDSLRPLWDEIASTARENALDIEAIFVDDGSRDDSWSQITALAAADARVRGIRFRRNFGKAAALSAGFEAVRGELVFTLDADLQDDPKEFPRFIAEIEKGKDVVSGWKQTRLDPWHKVWPSKVFNAMVGWMTGVRLHDHNCGFKCYRREVLSEIRLYGEMHRFVPVLAHARGFSIGEIPVHHRPRQHGVSKYGFERFVKGFLDLLTVRFLTGYSQRPQHLLGTLGLLAFAVGSIGMVFLTGTWICAQIFPKWELDPLHKRPALLYSVAALLLGAQLLSMGILAELIAAQTGNRANQFSIRERTKSSEPQSEPPGDAM
jgi:glycosyltransferase involved in cell wall biosynthesis